MARRESIILFGEGKCEAVILAHLERLWRDEIPARVKIDAGQGGSPRQVLERLIKKHLKLGAYDRALLLIDEDLPLDELPDKWLRKHRITLVTSSPRCLEGWLLTLLADPPPARDRAQSRNWKRRFHRNHLGTDRASETVARLRGKCPALFPRSALEAARTRHATLEAILEFLGV